MLKSVLVSDKKQFDFICTHISNLSNNLLHVVINVVKLKDSK